MFKWRYTGRRFRLPWVVVDRTVVVGAYPRFSLLFLLGCRPVTPKSPDTFSDE